MRFLACLLLSILHALSASAATYVATGNAKQAATLQAVATKIPQKSYIFTNVGTGEKLFYKATGNWIYPTAGGGSAIDIEWHGDATTWIRIGFGGKNKCLSSAWGGNANDAAVAYACKVGSGGVPGTLEPTKQWWIAVPIDHTTTTKPASNALLLAAQAESINTRAAAEAAVKSSFSSRRLVKRSKASLAAAKKAAAKKAAAKKAAAKKAAAKKAAARKAALKKAALKKAEAKKAAAKKAASKKTSSSKSSGKVLGTFYFIPSDHLIDMSARALTADVVTSRGVKNTALAAWQKGNKKQQWILTEA